jgi:plasmid stabilization system protein ParE
MPAELHWGEQAREDLIDIYLTIATENESAAEKIVESIEVRVTSLADYPRLGPSRGIARACRAELSDSL